MTDTDMDMDMADNDMEEEEDSDDIESYDAEEQAHKDQDDASVELLRVHSEDLPYVLADEVGCAFVMEEYTDIVFACDGGHTAKAHSVVMASASSFITKVSFSFFRSNF